MKSAEDQLRATLIKLDKEKDKTDALVEAVFEAVDLNLKSIRPPKVLKPRKDRRARPAEVAVAVLSDFQLGKTTSTYNSAVCEKRIELYADVVKDLTKIQRSVNPVRDCHVWILGDIVEGEMIFPGQAHLIDSSLYRQVAVDGPRILGNFLRRMLEEFDNVHVTAVPGNHGSLGGRARKDYHPESNADRILYRMVEQILAHESRLTWDIVEGAEDSWYRVVDIGGYKTLLFHGDQVGNPNSNIASISKRITGWKSGALNEHFDDAFFGHYHTVTKITVNKTTVRISGSPESDNGFARSTLASVARPSQQLMFARPGFGVTSESTVWLDR